MIRSYLIFRMLSLFLSLALLSFLASSCDQRACKDTTNPAICQGYACSADSLICLTSCTSTEECDKSRGNICNKTVCECPKTAGKDCVQDTDCNNSGETRDKAKPLLVDFVCVGKKCFAGCNFSCITTEACSKNEVLVSLVGDPKNKGYKCMNSNGELLVAGDAKGICKKDPFFVAPVVTEEIKTEPITKDAGIQEERVVETSAEKTNVEVVAEKTNVEVVTEKTNVEVVTEKTSTEKTSTDTKPKDY